MWYAKVMPIDGKNQLGKHIASFKQWNGSIQYAIQHAI